MRNSQIISFPLTGTEGGYFGQQFDPQQTVNLFLGKAPGTNYSAYITIPGSEEVYTHGSGDNTRALFNNFDNLFGIFGTNVTIFNSGLIPTSVGNLMTSAGYVGIQSNNSKQILFVDNVDGWVYDYSGAPTFTQISAAAFTDLNGPLDVDYLDGHMIVGFSGSNMWAISDIDNASMWDALNRAELTSGSDERITGIRVINRRIFIFGRYVTERWYNTGAASSFPFVRDDNLVLQYGCAATGSIVVGNLTNQETILVWLASQKNGYPTIRISDGGSSHPISDAAINYQLERFTTYDDACGYIYSIDGHTFYLINFPTEQKCFVYDFDTQKWHTQEMIDESTYFGSTHSFFNNKHYLGHYNAPKISELNSDLVKNENEAIHTRRTTSIFSLDTNERIEIKRLYLQMRQGTGHKTTTPTSAFTYDSFNLKPQIYMSHSADGGYTFGQQRMNEVGAVGESKWSTYWDGFEYGDKHVVRLETFNAVKTILVNMSAEITNLGY